MQFYCYKNQRDLTARVSFAWEMKEAPEMEARCEGTAWGMMRGACALEPCVCGSRWIPLTEELLERQVRKCPTRLQEEAPHAVAVRQAIRKALQEGAQKHTNVCFWGPASSGKSHVLKPLIALFKDQALKRPVGKSNFPLQQIFGKKVVVLQDFRTSTYNLSFDEYLVWWEGESFDVPIKFGNDLTYSERAPVFISTGDKPRIAPSEAKALEIDGAQQNTMMDKRLRYFHFAESLPVDEIVEVEPCAQCFSRWVCEGDGVGDASVNTVMPEAQSAASPSGGLLPPAAEMAAAPMQAAPAVAAAADALVDWLETHGGEIRLSGETCNLALVSDGVAWGQRFHADCGRLVPFLRRYGNFAAAQTDVVIGVAPSA